MFKFNIYTSQNKGILPYWINGKLVILVSYFISLSLLACAQKITVSETYKVKRKSAVIYSQYATSARLIFPADSISEINMRSGAGKLEVIPAENNEIEIEATIENRSLGKKKARKFIEKYMKLSMENINGTLEIVSYFEGTRRKFNNTRIGLGHMIETPGSKINVVLKVPKDIYLALNDRSGPIKIHNLQNSIYLRDRSGGISIKNIVGDLKIKDSSGLIGIANHEGNLTIQDGSGSIYLNGIGMEQKQYEISINDNSGRIDARGLGGNVILKDGSGGLQLSEVAGSVQINDRSGKIGISNVGAHVKIKDTSGGIYLKDIATFSEIADNIIIRDTSGAIYLKNAGTSAKITDRSGSVTVNDISGNLDITDRSGGISARNVSGSVTVKDKSGRVSADSYLVKNQR